MRKTVGVLVVALSWLSIRVMGQTHPVAVHAAHLLDVKSGKTLNDPTIVIEAGKIVSVGAAAALKVPADAVRIDLPGATLLPGLIDAHTHLTMDPKFGYERLAISVPREALIRAKNARATLLAGFTTVRNVGARDYTDVALRDAINAGAQHYRRALRRQHAALRISRYRGGGCRWHSSRAAQGAREHQVRVRSD